MKKLLLVSIALLVASGALFAAGADEAADAPEGPVTIDYSFWGNPVSIGVTREIIDAYYPQGIEENTFEGGLYGLPWGAAPHVTGGFPQISPPCSSRIRLS